jgi:DNA-binding XRE family transcriptional regulator
MNGYWMVHIEYYPELDARLRTCECGAEYCIPGERKGATVMRLTDSTYRVICLSCYKRGRVTASPQKAAEHWNVGSEKKSPGLILRQWREANGYSQEDVAKMTGLASVTISHIEIGRRHPEPRSKQRILEGTGIAL